MLVNKAFRNHYLEYTCIVVLNKVTLLNKSCHLNSRTQVRTPVRTQTYVRMYARTHTYTHSRTHKVHAAGEGDGPHPHVQALCGLHVVHPA